MPYLTWSIPADFLEEYDVAEVILETKGHHVSAKEFGRVLKFLSLLQEKHPELYRENFQYLDDFLVDYYCFHGDTEMVAVLWGCVYIYDYLLSIGLISREVHEKFIIQSRRLKGLVIGQFTPYLWEYSFVHNWNRPDSVAEAEFAEEQMIFRKSIEFKRAGFNELKKEISA